MDAKSEIMWFKSEILRPEQQIIGTKSELTDIRKEFLEPSQKS